VTAAPDPTRDELPGIRRRLDEADRAILEALQIRIEAARRIGEIKRQDGSGIRDASRELEVHARWASAADELALNSHAAGRVLREILEWSRREQEVHWRDSGGREAVVAYQGASGAHGDLAARRLMSIRGESAQTMGTRSFDGALAALRNGEADYALVPIENSIVGAVDAVDGLLLEEGIHIVDEEPWLVRHVIAAVPGATLEGIERVFSHPVALRQCRRTVVESLGLEAEEVWDTAGAADAVATSRNPRHAAICSAEAAAERGLVILRDDASDHPENTTRFLLLAREPQPVPPGIAVRTTLRLVANHQPGSLARCLGAFAAEGVNLTRLSSRVLPNRPGQHAFIIDLEGRADDDAVARAIAGVRPHARQVSVIGSYPDRTRPLAESVPRIESVTSSVVDAACPMPARASSSLPLASSGRRSETPTEIAGVPIGGGRFVLIAGPCAVESAEQIEDSAAMVRRAGAALLRGGAFKPRTSTYAFQGLGMDGVDLLVAAGRRHGLPVVTEVLQARDVEAIAERADVLQVGARNMQNFELLRRLGRCDRPILLKRGMSATIDEWLHAAEYILAGGNQQVVLCERGIRTFETSTRATLDLAAVPVLRERTHLPIIVDPSHAAGRRELVVPLALAAVAAGADGLIVECHPRPEEARCDREQAIDEADLQRLVAGLAPLLAAQGRSSS
jgi:3-deoxy-7-phosphoheptulonate synthase